MYKWDNKKPTAQMLGRWQPFHDGHYALFEEIIKKTGQVCIQIRDVQNVDYVKLATYRHEVLGGPRLFDAIHGKII